MAQRIGIFPADDLVIVVSYNTDEGDLVHDDFYYNIFNEILAARE